MMNDTSVYNLARRARKNLRATALCQEPDLRRVVGHANILDGLIAKLVDLGYDWNDDGPSEQISTVTDGLFTPSAHVQWADQVTSDTTTQKLRHSDEPSGDLNDLEDSRISDQSDNSDSDSADDWDDSDSDTTSESDQLDQCDFYDDSDAAIVETFEEYGNMNTCYSRYILITKAQTCSTPSPDISVLVSVRELE